MNNNFIFNIKYLILTALIFVVVSTSSASDDQYTMKGKVLLVTGGSKGIGLEVVKQALGQGAFVVAHYNNNKQHLDELLEKTSPESMRTIQADFSDLKAPSRLWEEALKWKDRVDVVINNAGILEYVNPSKDINEWHTIWQRALQINLIAPSDLCRAAINHFKQEQKGGIIVNVSSRAAFRGYGPDAMPYASSKAGLVALTRSIASTYAKDNILAYVVAPGITDTDMVTTFTNQYGEKALEKAREQIPLQEFAKPEEVARAILFLSSGSMKHSTGMTFDINGASYFH